MDKKSKVISNKRQLGRLVQLMQENEDIAKGICGKISSKPRWEAIAVELNSLGPPIRSWEKWLKVWTDLKSKTKKKLSTNRAEFRATGGGPNSLHILTPLEEAISNFLNFEPCTNPPGQEIGHSATTAEAFNETCASGLIEICIEDGGTTETQQTEVPEAQHRQTRRRKEKNTKSDERRMALLETQVSNQGKHFEAMEETAREIKTSIRYIESTVRKCYANQEQLLSIEKENLALNKEKIALKRGKLQILKDDIASRKESRRKKLKLKAELLELQKENVSAIIM